jgi:hypothetical protein
LLGQTLEFDIIASDAVVELSKMVE